MILKTTATARRHGGLRSAALGVFLVAVMGFLVDLLVNPGPVEPEGVPDPRVNPRALLRAAHQDEALAERATRAGLDVDVRELGSAIRAYGLADAAGAEQPGLDARKAVTQASRKAVLYSKQETLALRAFQERAFLAEVRRWAATGRESEELRELGGGFVRNVARNGWTKGRRLLLDEAALRALFKKRWNEVAGLQGEPFDLTADENRAFYRFLLRHPASSGIEKSDADVRAVAARLAHEGQYRLKKLEELAALDPTYPMALARGIVLYQMGRHHLAAESFRTHLEGAPDGPYTLRAQNYLRAAVTRATESAY
jgi:hypothetical protein